MYRDVTFERNFVSTTSAGRISDFQIVTERYAEYQAGSDSVYLCHFCSMLFDW